MGGCLDISARTLQHHFKPLVEGMHKVLTDYLMSTWSDLLRVVRRIEQMVTSQYNKYRKQLVSAKHNLKFKHQPGSHAVSNPRYPPHCHTPAIDRIRELDSLRRRERDTVRQVACGAD